MVMDALRALLSAFFGTLGFAILLQAPRRSWIPASGIGAVSFFLYWLLCLIIPESLALFCGAAVGAALAQVCARKMRMISTVFHTMAIVAFVPGLALYRLMAQAAVGEYSSAAHFGVSAMISIAMIALGSSVGSHLSRRRKHT